MGKIQNEIKKCIKKVSQLYHLIKGLLRNKDTNEKCKLDIFKIYFKRILQCGAETWTTTKREDSRIQPMEMKFHTQKWRKNNHNQMDRPN